MMQGLSRNLRRATRRARRRRAMELNIVSMIDILTVLVFFLLVNATGVSILGVNLPSTSSSPPKQTHDLRLVIRKTGLTLADEQGALRPLPNIGGAYDLTGLATMLDQIKDREPASDKITLLLEPDVAYDVLVQVMDTVRVQPATPGHPQRDLFPEISMGDAPQVNGQGGAAAASPAAATGGKP